MGFFKKLFGEKQYCYKINREVLIAYIQEQMVFSKEHKLSLVDEFYLKRDVDSKERLHVAILNYDVPCKDVSDIEKELHGIVIFANYDQIYHPLTDQRYSDAMDFVNVELADFSDEFIFVNEQCAPTSLEAYQI